jgi:dihydrofolate reductase
MQSYISLIAALSESTRVIGKEGKLPWRLKDDMRRFVEITSGHPVFMGRKTWESIPKKFRPLADRTNIVLTRQQDYVAEGAIAVHSLDELSRAVENVPGNHEVFCIGGGELYAEMLPWAKRLYLTLVSDTIDGDAYFPSYDGFKTVVYRSKDPIVEGNLSYTYLTLER